MIEREILVANTKTQTRKKITTNAATLGELKAVLTQEGIDYTDMTFTEGISKTQLLDDSTPLPRDVMYKGAPTNNLVILLTNTRKKIPSGMGTRKEAYAIIKENDMMEGIKDEFGYNYTNISTEDLWNYIGEHLDEDCNDSLDDDYTDNEDVNTPVDSLTLDEAREMISNAISTFKEVKASYEEKVKAIADFITELAKLLAESKQETIKINGSELSDDDINDMIASI